MAATTIPEVIARLCAIEAAAAPSDGVVCFARLYRQVTEGVNAQLAGGSFADPRFLERLDVVFANLFFGAVEANAHDPARTPAAWAPLFAARSSRSIAPLQFALAGMNAHINRDLRSRSSRPARSSDSSCAATRRSTPTTSSSTGCSSRWRSR